MAKMTKLEQLLQVISKKVVFIQTHNYPDQDALASAQGLKLLLEHFGIQAVICYKGEIDKYNTIKMIELLKLDITPADSIEFREDDETIFVDCQKGNSNVKTYCGKVIGCIDHHQLQDPSSYLFYDIRPNVGACATIIASYFLENNIPIDQLLATTLVYAIRMDTNLLSRSVSDLDLDIYCDLYKHSNRNIMHQLDSCTLKFKDLVTYHRAIEHLRIYHTVALIDLGTNCSEAIMGQISDFILTLREIDLVFAHSYRDNGVKYTVRSNRSDLDASEVVRQALENFGDGGGHNAMAAGFVPNVPNPNTAVTLSNIAEERVLEYVSDAMHWPREKRAKGKRIKNVQTIWNLIDGKRWI